jgi:hypothetical protein
MMLIVALNLWRIVFKHPQAMVPGDAQSLAPLAAEGVSE